jgi:meiotic recombination protein SPO11
MPSARKRSRAPSNGRQIVEKAADLDEVLAKTRELKEALRTKGNDKLDPEADSIPSGIVEVQELSSTEVIEGIEGVALNIAHQVLARKGFSMDIPSRAASVSVNYCFLFIVVLFSSFSRFPRCL